MTITRRDFIKNAAIAGLSLGLGNSLYAKTAPLKQAAASDNVLVVINLFGGNDGLNTVIPLTQYDRYRQLRQTLGFDRERILTLSDVQEFGLNPSMTSLRDLYANGKVAIINGVGVPPSAYGLFDHAAGQYEFQSCDVTGKVSNAPPSGWIGRFLDRTPDGVVSSGVDLGGGRLILTGAVKSPLTISSIDQFQLQLSFDSDARYRAYKSIMDTTKSTSSVGDKNRKIRSQALKQSEIIQERASGYTPAAEYPANDYLAYALMQSAQIITGNLGVRAITVGIGGFDTHSSQNQDVGGGLGYHDSLLRSVSDSIGAFYRDLSGHGYADRVMVLTISEFGRRPYENNDRGTDHGFGSVAFAVGDPVKGGVYGNYPSISEDRLVLDGNMDVTTDFRSLYSTVIANYLDGDPVPSVGGNFPRLGFV